MGSVVRSEISGRVAVVTVDNPPVNALSQAVRAGILDAITAAGGDPAVDAVVLICAGRTFIAGADIREFGKPLAAPDLRSVIEAIEDCPKPVIAAVHGTALGGGLETALGCHYRCAATAARLGVPEVKLGLLPGAGGTQRLPRLIGVKAALDMIVSGNPVAAPVALESGLIDRVIDGDLTAGALAYAEELAAEGATRRMIRDLSPDRSGLADNFFDQYRKAIARKARGLFAPERCIQAVEAAVTLDFEAGLARERKLFMDCMASPESAGLRHVFFAQRQATRIPDVPRDTPVRDIARAAVIGAGTMGGGIAMTFANAGIPVTLLEVKAAALSHGLGVIRDNYMASAKKGRLSEEEAEARVALITGTLDYADVADADIVIEAVFETMAIKKEVFARLDRVCKPGAILASNTSTLDLNQIAAMTGRPGDVIGTHFFSPANVMKLLEVVRGANTDKEVIATTMKLARRIAKVPVLAGVCYGFIGNRMLEGYGREAGFLLLEGASPAQIDKALFDFGMPMGPCAMGDLAGIDVGYLVRQERRDSLPDDPRYGLVADRLYEAGRLGQKTGAGYYRYQPGSRRPLADDAVTALIATEAKRLGIAQRSIPDDEIVKRCLYPIINEGARILDEGIALRPGDIDITWIYGYGFPPYRGGPMFYADGIGLAEILDTIRAYGADDPGFWTPAPLLEQLVAAGKTFAQFEEIK